MRMISEKTLKLSVLRSRTPTMVRCGGGNNL
jgi:hypothetical protein